MIIKALIILTLIFPTVSYAAFNDEVDSFLDEVGLGDNSNVTSATSWKGKASDYYSLGGFYTRSNVKNIQPLAVRLPELRAGCGGIDFYAGGIFLYQ
jgi:conjugative transfer pilus assembly protein TraH